MRCYINKIYKSMLLISQQTKCYNVHMNIYRPRTDFEFGIPAGSHVTLDIFNIMGQKVTRLVDGYYEPGMYTVTWDGTNSASGVYFYRIEAGEYIEMRKMLLLK